MDGMKGQWENFKFYVLHSFHPSDCLSISPDVSQTF